MKKALLLLTVVCGLAIGCKTSSDQSQLKGGVEHVHPEASLGEVDIKELSWTLEGQSFSSRCIDRPGKAPNIFRKCAKSRHGGLNRIRIGGWEEANDHRFTPPVDVEASVVFEREDAGSQAVAVAYVGVGVSHGSFKTKEFPVAVENDDLEITEDHSIPQVKLGGLFGGKTELKVFRVVVPFPEGLTAVGYRLHMSQLRLADGTGFFNEPPEVMIFKVNGDEHARVKANAGHPRSAYSGVSALRFE